MDPVQGQGNQVATVAAFNTANHAVVVEALLGCVNIDSWAEYVAIARPFSDIEEVLRVAESAPPWTAAEVEAALADHPRIGEVHHGSAASVASSAAEQSGVDSDDADLAALLQQGNRRYEERFDRVFLVRAAGRGAQEMLDLLEQRLKHDRETEEAVVAQQLREIALLRLRTLLGAATPFADKAPSADQAPLADKALR